MGDLKLANQRCVNCTSSDGMAIYKDGSGYCFSCEKYFSSERMEEEGRSYGNVTGMPSEYRPSDFLKGSFQAIPSRGLSQEACERFGIMVAPDGRVIFPYCNQKGHPIAQKVRSTVNPKGSWIGEHKDIVLFGQQLWVPSGSVRAITLVVGEFDTAAVWQMMGEWPVVSIPDGDGSAIKYCKANFEYLNGFDKIVLAFDNDPTGQEAALEVAHLFSGKSHIMKLVLKDANDYLREGKTDEFKHAWWSAPMYTPQGILSGADLWERISSKKDVKSIAYPYVKLQELTYGIRTGEMVTVVAGSGVGKSLWMREMAVHILGNTNENIGILAFEESVEKTGLGLMSVHLSKPMHLPDSKYTQEEALTAFNATVGRKNAEGKSRVYLYDHFGSTDVDSVISAVTFLAKAADCKYIFLDHISILVSDQSHGDERKALDEIATKLRSFVQDNDVCLFLVSHLRRPGAKPHEEGGQTSLADIRGTAGIGQLSDICLGLERNGQADDRIERNTTRLRVLKNRFSGLTGITSSLYYDHKTGRLLEIEETTPLKGKEGDD